MLKQAAINSLKEIAINKKGIAAEKIHNYFLDKIKKSKLSAFHENNKNSAHFSIKEIKAKELSYWLDKHQTKKYFNHESFVATPFIIGAKVIYQAIIKVQYNINESNYFDALNAYNPRIYDTIENTKEILEMDAFEKQKSRSKSYCVENAVPSDIVVMALSVLTESKVTSDIRELPFFRPNMNKMYGLHQDDNFFNFTLTKDVNLEEIFYADGKSFFDKNEIQKRKNTKHIALEYNVTAEYREQHERIKSIE